jgi:hypothetical protein
MLPHPWRSQRHLHRLQPLTTHCRRSKLCACVGKYLSRLISPFQKQKSPQQKQLTQPSVLVSRHRNFVGGSTPAKNLLPPMALTRIDLSISGESADRVFRRFRCRRHQPDASWNTDAVSPADWPAKQSDDSILDAVVRRFNDSVVSLEIELEQLCSAFDPVLDRPPFSWLLYFTASYFLGLGGISETSTGSNSNLGSSPSGAKYAFVVFRKFLSSRSGKSGL